ncbi:hypothetical protein X777_07051 [Ooceraea biroi]|uniref:Uncharacterized protein n=1 Tax=Ooceraea biroi TaxID=2015173 RepID=A0A026W9F6_OOCBI|nr:hypothetical protein X777_07051 [Ooceraea biroi]
MEVIPKLPVLPPRRDILKDSRFRGPIGLFFVVWKMLRMNDYHRYRRPSFRLLLDASADRIRSTFWRCPLMLPATFAILLFSLMLQDRTAIDIVVKLLDTHQVDRTEILFR